MLVVEATGIRDIPSGPLLRIGHDRFIPGLRHAGRQRCASESGGRTRLFIQVIDFLTVRRRPEPPYFGRYLAITERCATGSPRALGEPAVARRPGRRRARRLAGRRPRRSIEAVLDRRELEALDYGYRERVRDLHLPHIRELPAGPARALRRGRRAARREAGFDGVELHYAHAYTMASFLSR